MDKREQILGRIFAILKGVPDAKQWVRNRTDLPDDKRPALTLLDGDETALESSLTRGRPSFAQNLMTMRPEIYITLEARKPDNKLVGEDLNKYRAMLIKALVNDPTLISLTGGQIGNIRYLGTTTDLARGRTTDGEMGLIFAFIYLLRPNDL